MLSEIYGDDRSNRLQALIAYMACRPDLCTSVLDFFQNVELFLGINPLYFRVHVDHVLNPYESSQYKLSSTIYIESDSVEQTRIRPTARAPRFRSPNQVVSPQGGRQPEAGLPDVDHDEGASPSVG